MLNKAPLPAPGTREAAARGRPLPVGEVNVVASSEKCRFFSVYAEDASFVDPARLSPRQFEQFREFIYKKCGIRIDEKKITMLSNRIRRRLRAGQFRDFDVYFQHLNSPSGSSELEGFLDVITTHETSFFRTSKQFDWLQHEFVSELVQQHRDGKRSPKIRIWSAGCSNGAEAYSMAICLLENRYRLRDWQLQVVGTDISEESLAEARQGLFKSRMIAAVSKDHRRKYLRQSAVDLWQVQNSVKELVTFTPHNLMRPPHEHDYDCVFIRNVLIYFDQASKAVVIRNLLASLAEGGYLVVGPSEGVHELLRSMDKVSPLIYRKPESNGTSLPAVKAGSRLVPKPSVPRGGVS